MKRSKLLKVDTGMLGSRIHLFVGPHVLKSVLPVLRDLNYKGDSEDFLLKDYERCFGICYFIENGNSMIWINPENTIEETYEAITHELSHAIDNMFDVYGYTCNELRARLTGVISRQLIKGLGLIVKGK